MKRLVSIIALFFLVFNSTESSRVITSFEIARWYLDSDFVIICTVSKIDTIYFKHHDSLSIDNIKTSYDEVKEKYSISIDSVIKGDLSEGASISTILSQDFLINYSKTKEISKEFYGLDSKGDSIFQIAVEGFNDDMYFDFSYFRLNNQKKQLVILSKTESGYVIDYESECDDSMLELIEEIKRKGESYFNISPANSDQ